MPEGDSYVESQWTQRVRDRKLRDSRRAAQLKVARQRDSRLVEILKAKWAAEDALVRRTYTFEYICSICNRPFVLPRKIANPHFKSYCPPCHAFMRRKSKRDYAHSHKEQQRQYVAQRRLLAKQNGA